MAATRRLPKYAALCVKHRKVVGSNEHDAMWRWWQFHVKLHRCTAAEVRPTTEIRELLVERGLV
jgi:hypothetical protein